MSKISASDVQSLAALAKLSLSEGEVEKYRADIEAILGFIDQLQSVDVSDYEPTDQVSGLTNVMRPDTVQDFGVKPANLTSNRNTLGKLFKVKRVFE